MLANNKKQKTIALGNYGLKTTIGKGISAVVKLATHNYTKEKVAIKIFDRSALDNDKSARLIREIDSMKTLKHQNIIQLYEVRSKFNSLFFFFFIYKINNFVKRLWKHQSSYV